jgi:type 1 glutamine amidotransferase
MGSLTILLVCGMALGEPAPLQADEPKQLLLLGQSPDGHPRATHEYMPGQQIVAHLLKDVPDLKTRIVLADDPWPDGPRLIGESDGVVLFVSEGARWIQADPRRYEALLKLAERGGGLAVLHWGMGSRKAEYVDGFTRLFGGCHGGPDRRYKVIETQLKVAAPKHPIAAGLTDLRLRDEFYYRLKFPPAPAKVNPLLTATIEDRDETVAWTWQRDDGGRSFGFSGLHFHDNWRQETYRRLVAQAALWVLKMPLPEEGVNVDVESALLRLTPKPD